MSDHGYTGSNILSQLPHVLAEDTRMAALGAVIARALVVHLQELRLSEIYTRIDELPEPLVDLLARDFKVDWYDYDSPPEAKRSLLKSSYAVHRMLGTPEAVAMAVRAAFGDGASVQEWFDYGGSPHHFRVSGLSAELVNEGMDLFLRLLGVVQRRSSVLDGVGILDSTEGTFFAGSGEHRGDTITVFCETPAGEVDYITDEYGDFLLDELGVRIINEEA